MIIVEIINSNPVFGEVFGDYDAWIMIVFFAVPRGPLCLRALTGFCLLWESEVVRTRKER